MLLKKMIFLSITPKLLAFSSNKWAKWAVRFCDAAHFLPFFSVKEPEAEGQRLKQKGEHEERWITSLEAPSSWSTLICFSFQHPFIHLTHPGLSAFHVLLLYLTAVLAWREKVCHQSLVLTSPFTVLQTNKTECSSHLNIYCTAYAFG